MSKSTKQISEHAAVAKLIRAELKANGITATVKAASGSMTSKVTIDLLDCPPWTVDAITSATEKYQYGHFDGMNDMYVNSNTDITIPQVKFIFVTQSFSDKLKQDALDQVCLSYNLDQVDLADAPATLPIISPVNDHITCYTSEMIHKTLVGRSSDYFRYPSFWLKPVKRIMAVSGNPTPLAPAAPAQEPTPKITPPNNYKVLNLCDFPPKALIEGALKRINPLRAKVLMDQSPTELHRIKNKYDQEVIFYEHPEGGEELPILGMINGTLFNTGFYDCGGFYEGSDYLPVLYHNLINCDFWIDDNCVRKGLFHKELLG